MTRAALLFVHVFAAALWIGGMAAMHFAVRPAAVATLPPPQRVPFMAAAVGRFLNLVAVAIGALLASAVALIAIGNGLAALHWSVHAMTAIGLAMVAVYLHIRFATYPALTRAVQATQWPQAAQALDGVRKLVLVNLALGTLVFALALTGRSL